MRAKIGIVCNLNCLEVELEGVHTQVQSKFTGYCSQLFLLGQYANPWKLVYCASEQPYDFDVRTVAARATTLPKYQR